MAALLITVVSTASASAEFGSLNGEVTHGTAKALSETVLEGGGGKIKCPAEGTEVEWKIQSKGEIGKQKEVVEGPHLNLTFKWPSKGCTAELGTFKESVVLSECTLQLVQEGNQTKVSSGVVTPCVAKTSVCEIKVVEANEKTGENFELKESVLENEGQNLNIKEADEGVTIVASGALCPVKKNKESKLKWAVEAQQVEGMPAKWESPRNTLYSGDAWGKSTTAGVKFKDAIPSLGEEETVTCQVKLDFNVENAPTRGLSNWVTDTKADPEEIIYSACTTSRPNCTVTLAAQNVMETEDGATKPLGVTRDTIYKLKYLETLAGVGCNGGGPYTIVTEPRGCPGTWTNPNGGETAFAVIDSECLKVGLVPIKMKGTIRFRAGEPESTNTLFLE
ncbi:MAG TPA: hypothetical protein VGY76_06980 [Solirubrobacteraceae bacterium]|jgi:hypothetical protein|nr:hypothetical protein [Solirubrobacteraceae bacterium]